MIVVLNPTATMKDASEVVASIGAPAHDTRVTQLNGRIIVVTSK